MLKLDKFLLIFSDPKRFISGLYRYFDWLVIDKIFFLISFLIFSLCPQYLYLIYNKPFPLFSKKERWIKKNNPEDEWIYKKKSIIFNEINIVVRGNYQKYLKKINKKLPTFFVNFHYKPNINIPYICITGIGGEKKYHEWQIERFRDRLYPVIVWRCGVMSGEKILWAKERHPYPNINYLKKIDNHLPKKLRGTYKIYEKKKIKFSKKNYKMCQLVKKKTLVHFRDFNGTKNIGGALGTILILGSSSKKVNVYGWDYYLEKDIDKYGYWELVRALSKSTKGKGYIGGVYNPVSLKGAWGERSKQHFSGAILNMHYASRLIEQKKYKIFSRLSKIHKQNKFLKNIDRIFFKN